MKIFLSIMLFGCAAGWSADWLTDGHDPQRTGWQKDEKILNVANVGKMKLLWKVQTGNVPRQMHSLFPPLIVGKTAMKGGTREIAILAGASDNIYAIDVEKGEIVWQKHFETGMDETGGRGAILCPGGTTATPVVGPADAQGKYTLYSVSWDGMLHQLNVADGEDVAPPARFLPPNGKPYGLNLFHGVVYTMTAQVCGGAANYIYSFDLATKRASLYSPGGGGLWGYRGPAIGADGTVYAPTG